MLAICLVFVLSTGVEAKEGGITATKMGDSTIERVCRYTPSETYKIPDI